MKICFLGDAGSVHIRRWVEFFRDKNHQVSIISFRSAIIENVDVRFIGDHINIDSSGGNIMYLKKIRVIKKIIDEINPDIINAHYLTSYGLLGALTKKRPLIVSAWGSDILVTPKRNIIYKKLTQYVLKKSDLVTSDSNFMSKEIEGLGYNKEKIITVPMGINPSEFNLEGRSKEKNKIILSMRTLCDNSNIDIIIKAFKKLYEEDKEVKLIITNSGDKEDVILNLIEELKLNKAIEFLGFINREKVVELLKKANSFISIPTSDSTSVTLLEAMACGIFPIVSDLPANNEWINDKENGFVLKQYSEEELYNLMKNSMMDDELLISTKVKNTRIIKERAIWEENMNYIIDKYRSVI